MELDFSYSEMALVREMAQDRQGEKIKQWCKLAKNKSPESMQQIRDQVMSVKNPYTEEGRLNKILSEIQKIEDLMKNAIENPH